jgi:peroxiredoxin
VDNGVIEKLFVENGKRDNADTDPYEVSTPENVLEYVAANVKVGATA